MCINSFLKIYFKIFLIIEIRMDIASKISNIFKRILAIVNINDTTTINIINKTNVTKHISIPLYL